MSLAACLCAGEERGWPEAEATDFSISALLTYEGPEICRADLSGKRWFGVYETDGGSDLALARTTDIYWLNERLAEI